MGFWQEELLRVFEESKKRVELLLQHLKVQQQTMDAGGHAAEVSHCISFEWCGFSSSNEYKLTNCFVNHKL